MPHPTMLPPEPGTTWAPAMREEVRRVVAEAGWRRHLPPRCWVGHPGGPTDDDLSGTVGVVEVVAPSDALAAQLGAGGLAGLRAELVERAVDGLDDPTGALCWLARTGPLGVGDLELGWWAAALSGFGRHGLVPQGFCVLNRSGWLDLASGRGRTWTRLRPR